MSTRRWRLDVAYDGSKFHGFAAQPGVTTVAGALGKALGRVLRLGDAPQITCAGRTDSGVHARGQVIHVDLPATLPPPRAKHGGEEMSAGDLLHALNRKLAPDVVVRAATPAPEGFDARRSALARRYRYLVWNAPVADPLLAPIAWHLSAPLDLRTLKGAADALIGEHDFRAFCRRPPGTESSEPITRRVTDVWIGEEATDAAGGVLIRFEIEAQSFCHQMVRSIVAALVEVGSGKATSASIVELLRATDRSDAPEPAPPHGLCLVSVTYESPEGVEAQSRENGG